MSLRLASLYLSVIAAGAASTWAAGIAGWPATTTILLVTACGTPIGLIAVAALEGVGQRRGPARSKVALPGRILNNHLMMMAQSSGSAAGSGSSTRVVFVSYSREDTPWLERFEVMLKPHVRKGDIELWTDNAIGTGSQWGVEIEAAISRADCALLLISPHFFNSDFIMNQELPALIEREVTLACVLVRDCKYEAVPELARVQWTHDPKRDGSIATSKDPDAAIKGVSLKLLAVLDSAKPRNSGVKEGQPSGPRSNAVAAQAPQARRLRDAGKRVLADVSSAQSQVGFLCGWVGLALFFAGVVDDVWGIAAAVCLCVAGRFGANAALAGMVSPDRDTTQ